MLVEIEAWAVDLRATYLGRSPANNFGPLAFRFCQDFLEEPVIDKLSYRNVTLELCLLANLRDFGFDGILRDRPISRENLDDFS